MAILDINTALATAFAPTSGTQYPSVYLDTGALTDWGMGNDWIWYIQLAATFTAGTSLDLQLQGNNTDPTFATGTSVIILDTGAIAEANLLIGAEFKMKVGRTFTYANANLNINDYRYIRIKNITVGTHTTGTYNSWLTNDAMQDNLPPAIGYTVK